MASSTKKRVNEKLAAREDDVEAAEDDDDLDSEEDDDDDEFVDQEVQVEFEARMPIDSDFHGIRTLLQQLFLKASINLSELTDTIISQNYVGSVIKCDTSDDSEDEDDNDDEPVFGVFTVINLTDKKELESVQQITAMLTDHCDESGQMDMSKFSSLIDDPEQHIALLISERFINIPPQIAVPSFESLKKDLRNAVSKKMNFKFANFLMISKTYRMKTPGQKKSGSEDLLFSNSEEELIFEMCDCHFTYSVAKERDSVVGGEWDEDGMEALRTVMIFSADKMDSVILKLKTVLSNIE